MRRLRGGWSPNTKSPAGRPSWGFGLRVGYWPCLRGPYLQIALGTRRLDVWHGLPSYR